MLNSKFFYINREEQSEKIKDFLNVIGTPEAIIGLSDAINDSSLHIDLAGATPTTFSLTDVPTPLFGTSNRQIYSVNSKIFTINPTTKKFKTNASDIFVRGKLMISTAATIRVIVGLEVNGVVVEKFAIENNELFEITTHISFSYFNCKPTDVFDIMIAADPDEYSIFPIADFDTTIISGTFNIKTI